jgi:hypothetical protein
MAHRNRPTPPPPRQDRGRARRSRSRPLARASQRRAPARCSQARDSRSAQRCHPHAGHRKRSGARRRHRDLDVGRRRTTGLSRCNWTRRSRLARAHSLRPQADRSARTGDRFRDPAPRHDRPAGPERRCRLPSTDRDRHPRTAASPAPRPGRHRSSLDRHRQFRAATASTTSTSSRCGSETPTIGSRSSTSTATRSPGSPTDSSGASTTFGSTTAAKSCRRPNGSARARPARSVIRTARKAARPKPPKPRATVSHSRRTPLGQSSPTSRVAGPADDHDPGPAPRPRP